MQTPLIGIMGLKQSGKDTLASRLTSTHGYTRFALADPMRDFALALDPIIAPSFRAGEEGSVRLSAVIRAYGWEKAKERIPEVRRTLQRLGTEAGREVIGEDFWVNVTDAKITAHPGPAVVTDIRFPNEYAWVKRRGGVLVRVIRPGQSSTDPHPSEAMAEDVENYPGDVEVLNVGTVDDLLDTADHLIEILRETGIPTLF